LDSLEHEQIMHELYIKKDTLCSMPNETWKCFRCNLSFKNEEISNIHKEITSHRITITK